MVLDRRRWLFALRRAGLTENSRQARRALACPPAHDPGSSRKAEIDQLTPEPGSIVTALHPASFEVVTIGNENTFSPWLAPKRRMTSTQPTSDRFGFNTEPPGNTRDGDTRRMQPRGFLIAQVPTSMGRPPTSIHQGARRVGRAGRHR